MGLHEGSRLLAFVVASTSGGQKAGAEQIPAASAKHREDLPSSVTRRQEEMGIADGDFKSLILNQLSLQLPSHSVPDTVVLVPALCLTNHGEC